jgi:hypothetical protein
MGRFDSLRGMAPANARKSLIGKGGVMVGRNFTSWNQLDGWLQQVDVLRRAA